MNYKEIARQIFLVTGPADNIKTINHCMTRLRLNLMKLSPDMEERLNRIDGVISTNRNGDELQIILGPGRVDHVTDEFSQLIHESANAMADKTTTDKTKPAIGDGKELHAKIRAQNATPIKLFFKRIASIFVPLIPAFIACGLISGLLNVAAKVDPSFSAATWFQLLAVAGNVIFWGMNLFIGFNAAKEFGGTPILGGILGGLITHPGLAGITLYNTPLVPGRGGVISVLLIAALGAFIERKLKHIIPEMFSLFLTPLFTFLLTGTIAILFLQPLGGFLSDLIGQTVTTAVNAGGAITGFVLGGLWLPLVMLGLHQAFTPIHVDLLARYGVTILLPILAMAGAGQVGASLAVYQKTKNKRLKQTVASALPVGIMGIGEPLIYGVTFPLGKPFIGACIGGAFGGAVQAAFGIGSAALGISGLPLAAGTNNIPLYLIGLVTAYAVGFIATWLIGFEDPTDDT